MAAPLTADQFIAALKAEGVHVAEHPGWRDHERDAATGKTFGPVHGVLIHHTAGTNSLATVYGGRPGLPGPLAHGHLAKTGLATMCSAGRANHAGLAAVNAYNAILNESPTHPKPSAASGTVDGNDVLYGLEIENLGNGRDEYPGVQYDAAVRWAAALCRAHGWGANSVAGHKETSVEGKIDPSFDMNLFRADVAERLTHPASWNPTDQEDDPMAGITPQQIHDAVWRIDDLAAPTTSTTIKTNPKWTPASLMADVVNNVRAIRTAETAQTAAITALAKLVGSGVDTAAVVAAVREEIRDAVIKVSVDVNGQDA